jgi:hypothetical protein
VHMIIHRLSVLALGSSDAQFLMKKNHSKRAAWDGLDVAKIMLELRSGYVNCDLSREHTIIYTPVVDVAQH